MCRAKNQSEDGAGFLPPTPSSRAVRVPHFAPPHCPSHRWQNPERKTPFPFSRKNSPPPNQKSKECFFFRGCRRVREAGSGAIRRAYDLGQSHHALRAWHIIRDSAGNESELFDIMTTKQKFRLLNRNFCLVVFV